MKYTLQPGFDPRGPFSTAIQLTSIASNGLQGGETCGARFNCSKHAKRGPYTNLTLAQKAEIGKRVSEYDITVDATIHALLREWAWLSRILGPRNLFSQNVSNGQSVKNLSLENLTLYGILLCHGWEVHIHRPSHVIIYNTLCHRALALIFFVERDGSYNS